MIYVHTIHAALALPFRTPQVTEKKGDPTKMPKPEAKKEEKKELLAGDVKNPGSGLTDIEVAVMYGKLVATRCVGFNACCAEKTSMQPITGLVDENGEYDNEAVQELQKQLTEAAGPVEDPRDSTKHDMIFHWAVLIFSCIVSVRFWQSIVKLF